MIFSGGKKIKINPRIWINKLKNRTMSHKNKEIRTRGASLVDLKYNKDDDE